MELAFLLSASVTFTHLVGALIRYEPFHDVLSRRQKKELFWSFTLIAIVMFPVYVLIFRNPDTQVPYLKTAHSMGAFLYVAANFFWFHTRIAQQIYTGGMQGLWASTIHTISGFLVYHLFDIDISFDQVWVIAVIDPLLNALFLPLGIYFFRRMRPSSLLMSDRPYGYYMAVLPLVILFIQYPQNLNMDQYFWAPDRISMRIITAACFFLIYKGVRLEDENLAEEIHLRSMNDTQRKTIHFLQSYTLLVQQGTKKFSILRHDMRHHIQLVYALIHDDRKEEALRALESYDAQLNKTAIRPYSLNPYINAILSVYMNRAKEEGFSTSTEVNFPETAPVLEERLSVVLANLLENSIRVTSRESRDKRFLRVQLQTKGKQAILSVENYCSRPIDFDKDGFPRTAREGHGIGMISVRKFIEQYKGYKDFTQTCGTVKFIIYFRMDVPKQPCKKDG